MKKLASPRLITDSMSGGGVANERFSMTGPGSPSIDVDSSIMPPEQLGNVMQAPTAVIPLNYPPNRYEGQSEMPTAQRQTGPWTDPGYMAEGSRDPAGFEQT